jgi:ribosomal protein S12 methylthiotransferase
MADGKLLPYLDVPFQHASNRILKAMRRPAAEERTLERIRQWRKQVPALTLRSTFIVGFPGETEADFESLLNWLDAAELDRVGCFKYEPVSGAAANALPDAVPDDLKEERWHRLMSAQQAISARRLQQRVGGVISVLVDEIDGDDGIGRSQGDAPEIDGKVFLRGRNLSVGALVDAEVVRAGEYDLWATAIEA